AHLAGPEPRVLAPLGEDLAIALRLDLARRRTARRRRAFASRGLRDLAPPLVDGESAHSELPVSGAHAVLRGVLEHLRLLRRRVPTRRTRVCLRRGRLRRGRLRRGRVARLVADDLLLLRRSRDRRRR